MMRAAAAAGLLALALAACGAGGGTQATAVPPTEPAAAEPTPAPATPEPATSEPATPAPTTVLTTEPATAQPTAQPTAPPAVVYVDAGRALARSGLDDLAELATLGEGVLGAALVDDDTLLVLREDGIERVSLGDRAAEQVIALDRPAVFGLFRPTSYGPVLFDVRVSEPESVTPFGMGTRIGSYDPATGAAQQIIAAPETLELLGVTADGGSLLTMPRGQDPAFGALQIRSIETGEVEESLDVPGEGFALVSPDVRWAAVSSRRYEGADGTGVDELLLYDLSARPVTARTVTLPQTGAANAGVWAPDGSRFFFSYGPGNIYELQGSYGLWQLDPVTLEVSQVAGVDVQSRRIDGISPDGFVLLRGLTVDAAVLVDTATGAVSETVVPPSAFVAGFR